MTATTRKAVTLSYELQTSHQNMCYLDGISNPWHREYNVGPKTVLLLSLWPTCHHSVTIPAILTQAQVIEWNSIGDQIPGSNAGQTSHNICTPPPMPSSQPCSISRCFSPIAQPCIGQMILEVDVIKKGRKRIIQRSGQREISLPDFGVWGFCCGVAEDSTYVLSTGKRLPPSVRSSETSVKRKKEYYREVAREK